MRTKSLRNQKFFGLPLKESPLRMMSSANLFELASCLPFRRSVAHFFILVSCVASAGCSTATAKLNARNKINSPNSRVFFAKFDEVEAALKFAMIKYPQRIDNSDAGILETDYLRGDARFVPAHAPDTRYSNGYKYKVLVRVIRGRAEKPATKVLVTKQVELVRDFFAPPEQATSDGLEESVILYRIGREVSIARALAKASTTPGESQGQ